MTAPAAEASGAVAPRRVLLDECVPRRLKRSLPGLDVVHVRDIGWTGKRNGVLLGLMLGAGYEVFMTVDRNLEYQQNVAAAGVAVVVLLARTNRLADLLPLASRATEVAAGAGAGTVTRIAA